MAAAITGTPQENSASGGGASLAVSFTGANAPAAGETLVAYVTSEWAPTTIGMSDSVNGSYGTALEDKQDTADDQECWLWYFPNCAGGDTTLTVSWTPNMQYRGLFACRVSGAAAAPLNGHSSNYQASPASGADVVTSGAASNTSGHAALMIGFSCKTDGTTVATQGTGFTSLGTYWSGLAPLRVEYKNYTTSGSDAATFTRGSAGDHVTANIILDDAAAGGSVSDPPQNVGMNHLARVPRIINRCLAVERRARSGRSFSFARTSPGSLWLPSAPTILEARA